MNTGFGNDYSVDSSKSLVRNVNRNRRNANRQEIIAKKGLNNRSRSEIESQVLQTLKSELLASELLFCLFKTSLTSLRMTTICDPFPQFLINANKEYLFSEAEIFVKAFPPLKTFVSTPSLLSNLPLDALVLLDWIINPISDGFRLKCIPVDEYLDKVSKKDSKRHQYKHSLPDFVFELVYDESNEHYCQFEQLKSQYGYILGYHGSLLENFHSIARGGLDESFGNSNSIFGEGIYFSQDRDVAHSFQRMAPHHVEGTGLGDTIGIMTSTEIIDHPDQVRRSKRPVANSQNDASSLSILLEDKEYQELPKGYIISKSANFVLTKYLLVYSLKSQLPNAPILKTKRIPRSLLSFLLVAFYVLVLVCVWYFKGKAQYGHIWKRYTSSWNQ